MHGNYPNLWLHDIQLTVYQVNRKESVIKQKLDIDIAMQLEVHVLQTGNNAKNASVDTRLSERCSQLRNLKIIYTKNLHATDVAQMWSQNMCKCICQHSIRSCEG